MRRLSGAAWVLGAAILIAAFWKLRLSDPADHVAIYSRDAYQQAYPMWLRIGEWMRAGEWPLWNPYQMLGHPLHASVLYGVLYPLNAARLVSSPAVAIEITIALHLFVGWCFAFWYGRALGLERLAAYCAATAFALAGNTVLNAVWFPPVIGAMVWLPAALLAIEGIVRRQQRRWAGLLAIAVAMPVLSGWLQDWLHMSHALALYAAVRLGAMLLGQGDRRGAARAAILLGLGVCLGVALAAVQLLPSIELQGLGWRRPGGLTLEQSLPSGGVSPSRWLAEAGASEPAMPRFGYAGVVTVLLLPVSLLALRRSSAVTALWALGAWGILVAMTTATPAFALYRLLPGGTWFREPWRIIALYVLAVAMLAGIGAQLFLDAQRGRAAVAAALSTLVGAAWWWSGVPPRSELLIVVALGLLWSAVAAPVRWRSVPMGLLAVALTSDLFLAAYVTAQRPYQNLAALEKEAGLLEYVRARQGLDRTFLYHPWPFEPEIMAKQGTLRGIYMVTDYEVLSLDRHRRYYAAIEQGRDSVDSGGGFIGMLRMWQPTPQGVRLLDLMSVRYVIAPKTHSPYAELVRNHGWQALFVPVHSDYALFRNPRPLPRAYVAHSVSVVPDDVTALRTLLRPRFDPWKAAVVEQEVGGLRMSAHTPRITPAEIRVYEPLRVEIDVDSASDGLLVLTDTHYPGWKAFVDGEPRPILRANYLFRGVQVAAGRRRVEFRFEPASVRTGGFVSALALLCLCGLLLPWRIGATAP